MSIFMLLIIIGMIMVAISAIFIFVKKNAFPSLLCLVILAIIVVVYVACGPRNSTRTFVAEESIPVAGIKNGNATYIDEDGNIAKADITLFLEDGDSNARVELGKTYLGPFWDEMSVAYIRQ